MENPKAAAIFARGEVGKADDPALGEQAQGASSRR
jgi:hypothetical protein